ncbi:MAG TPA: ATP-binding protein [Thiobacillus sp.]|nr:MAG: hypothetical protein B7Y50_11560 [Hydrogenophilales bacterium 28-61-11]OYZ56448.1 MAG: hypothetical protein B7Y21_11550 [Hydrogenophilales bacterium 16-61-112]OZA43347.1 MAG: hypothetical protein B7X81_11405 [Hydrogenophilales bacterium 17-61-76]HQT29934.1 ATP-binding protein [Thiobacillus sp.]HQT69339.1 ATP-binding protein [Thiobacillus sp.]
MKPSFNSFYYRTAAALFLGILASAVLLLGTGWLLVGKPMVLHSTLGFAQQIQKAANSYHLVPEPDRNPFRERLFQDHAITLEPAPDAVLVGKRSRLPYFIHLEEALSRLAGKPVHLLRQGEIYSFDFPARNGTLRFHFSSSRLGSEPILALFTMVALALLSSLLSAMLIAKYTARPIEAIAHHTETHDHCDLPAPFPEKGPQELRDIVRNFNHLTAQNRELLNNSAIMLAGISHDLRAPITRARMALELARANMDESLALRIERALIQMETLIAQYLDFTGGSIKEGSSPLNIPSLLKEILQTYKHSEIHLDVCQDIVDLPSRAFIRCAQNLLDNAVKHGAGALINVSFLKTASTWTLEIADHGPGIPDSQLEHVFQPFLRLDNARTQTGSGLGLSIVQEICRVQGWFVTLVPRPGGGLVARLSLPIAAQN